MAPNLKFKRGGMPRKYEFHNLVVGQSCVVPWVLDSKGFVDDVVARRVLDALYKCQRRKGWYFQTSGTNAGLLVRRVR